MSNANNIKTIGGSAIYYIQLPLIGYLKLSYVFGNKMVTVTKPALVRLWTCVVCFTKVIESNV